MIIETDTDVSIQYLLPNGLKRTDVEPLNGLLAEFSPNATMLSFLDWRQLTLLNHMIVAYTPERRIVGMATLVINCIPTGRIGFVEDVVVAKRLQGRGIGKNLMRFLIKAARESGLKQLDLTSRPSREAANKMYLSLGFEKRNTNVYRLTL